MPPRDAVDLLWNGEAAVELEAPRLPTPHTHGTGCTLAAAITAGLAAGLSVPQAVRAAKRYLTGALERAFLLGAGIGPVDHAWCWRRAAVNPLVATHPSGRERDPRPREPDPRPRR